MKVLRTNMGVQEYIRKATGIDTEITEANCGGPKGCEHRSYDWENEDCQACVEEYNSYVYQ